MQTHETKNNEELCHGVHRLTFIHGGATGYCPCGWLLGSGLDRETITRGYLSHVDQQPCSEDF